ERAARAGAGRRARHRSAGAAIRARRTLGSCGYAGTRRSDWREVQGVEQCRRRYGGRSRRAGEGGGRAGEEVVNDAWEMRVFSVADHPLLRDGIAAIVNNEPDMIMVAQAATGQDAITQFRDARPDVTLMDLRLPDISGIDALIAIRADFPDAR